LFAAGDTPDAAPIVPQDGPARLAETGASALALALAAGGAIVLALTMQPGRRSKRPADTYDFESAGAR
jgi:hypothetical protein